MILEGYLALWGLIVLFLIFAEWGSVKKYSVGVLAGLLILLSGFYSLEDGIQFRTGELKRIDYAFLQNITNNITTNYNELQEQTSNTTTQLTGNSSGIELGEKKGIQAGTENITYIYTDINPKPAIFSFAGLMGLVQVLFGIYTILHYGLRLSS